jgi:tryptophan synthase alpha chain
VLDTIREADLEVPVAVMTYVNPVLRRGVERFLDEAASAGIAGMIVPDLPVDESEELRKACAARNIDMVPLAAPGASDARLRDIVASAGGFVYCVATYGVTGAREELGSTAQDLVVRLRPLTDLPLLVGVGIGVPEQAREASGFADGVIVGSALMQRVVDGDLDGAIRLVEGFRAALPLGR